MLFFKRSGSTMVFFRSIRRFGLPLPVLNLLVDSPVGIGPGIGPGIGSVSAVVKDIDGIVAVVVMEAEEEEPTAAGTVLCVLL